MLRGMERFEAACLGEKRAVFLFTVIVNGLQVCLMLFKMKLNLPSSRYSSSIISSFLLLLSSSRSTISYYYVLFIVLFSFSI